MITIGEKNELEEILDTLGENLSITESQHDAAVRSYKAVGAWLTGDDSELAEYNPVISPQGSFIIGTTIQTVDPDGDLDLDIVCELNGKRVNWTQKDVKELVGGQLSKHKKYESLLDEEGRRCWTLRYRENGVPNERYHMDILPAINTKGYSVILEKAYSNLKDQNIDELVLSITDNERPEYHYSINPADWLQSNPFGYAKWFMSIAEDIKGFKSKMFSLNESVNPTPKYQADRLPLQRAVQLLKRHRDIMFKDYNEEDKKEKPISCIITTLAAHAYNGEDNVTDALINIVSNMRNYIEDRFDEKLYRNIKWISNPVNPTENFADRWPLPGSKREQFFNDWLDKAKEDFLNLRFPENKRMLNESLQSYFGSEPVKKTFSDIGNKMRWLTESGNNHVDRNLGVIGTATSGLSAVSKIKPHNFFGNDKEE
ncbi:nucleotidyltransferase [Chryseobacterium sp. S0630]|uniref:nucleotidyltransferase domain-containing protein n=1 Tax=Chryseobacterium sp. S0630 TaxID=2957803 RepID=UPI0020A03B96|nr:nucleotidyltransferase [Chryseobacterium sp. S0630]MCP1298736.1 nucleotidyltransferase [Chryseobacterium sp. S0630]